jgi:hypothetical protein
VYFTANLDVTAIGIIVGIIGIIVGIVVGIFGVVFEIIKLKREKQREKFLIDLTPRYCHVTGPVESNMAIEVRPEKSIADCIVLFNGERLLCDENKKYAKHILVGGTGLYRIPIGKEKDENAEVVVLDGKKELLREKLRDIHG